MNNKYEFQHAETDKRLGYFMRAIIWLNAHLVQFKQLFFYEIRKSQGDDAKQIQSRQSRQSDFSKF